MSTKIPCSALILATSLLIASSIQAGVIHSSGLSDAVVNRDWGAGFPSSTWVSHQTTTTLVADYDPSDSSYRYWRVPELQFPVDGMEGMTNLTATLSLYVTDPGVGNMQLRFRGDGTGTVLPSDAMNGGSVITLFPSNVTGWQQFDVSSELQLAVDSGYDWAVFTVRPDDWYNSITIAASEDATHSPTITFVPESSAVPLLVAALAAAWLSARRQL